MNCFDPFGVIAVQTILLSLLLFVVLYTSVLHARIKSLKKALLLAARTINEADEMDEELAASAARGTS